MKSLPLDTILQLEPAIQVAPCGVRRAISGNQKEP